MRSRFLLFLFLLPITANAIDDWRHAPTSMQGKVLQTTCEGDAPSSSLAKGSAIKNCQAFASDYLSSELKVSRLSVETEKDVAFHQAVSSKATYKNLMCDVQKEQVEERDGSFKAWVRCKFDLSTVKSEPIADAQEEEEQPTQQHLDQEFVLPDRIESDKRIVDIFTSPACDSILVESGTSKVIRCNGNQQTVVLDRQPARVLIRKSGYPPITVGDSELRNGGRIEKVFRHK